MAGLRRASTNRVGAELRFVQRKVGFFCLGLLGLLGKVLVQLGKVLVLLLLLEEGAASAGRQRRRRWSAAGELRPHCEGQTLLLLGRITDCL